MGRSLRDKVNAILPEFKCKFPVAHIPVLILEDKNYKNWKIKFREMYKKSGDYVPF